MAQKPYRLYFVSVDFDTKATRRRSMSWYYNKLRTTLARLGGVLGPTLQVKLLLTRHSAARIRDQIKKFTHPSKDRIYVGRIARGSAWKNPLRVSNERLKQILKVYAGGVEPTAKEIKAASFALKGLIPRN
jgi:hypothetical protein